MTNDRAREVAKQIFNRAWSLGWTLDKISETETDILAYRDEVRRETLKEVKGRSESVPDFTTYLSFARDVAINASSVQRLLFRDMLDEMITATGPVSASPSDVSVSGSGSGMAVVVGCDSPNVDDDRDLVMRTLAQAHAGDDYTIEGRKFQAAVERLWRR